MVKKWSVSYPAVNGTEQRRVYVYLPTMYEAEPDRRYPVLYMFDGQNVFFDEDATFGKSWGVADYLDYTDTPLIVAAVECNAGANNERLVEYSPYRFDDPQFGHFDGKGQATMSWYIHRFKPFIDHNFRTLPDREHTFIGGSSMGGLMSLYALLQYNDTFSRAAALSPSIWVSPEKLSGLVGPHGLEHVAQTGAAAVPETAGEHGTAGADDGRNVQPQCCHDHAGYDLVAVGNQH